MTKKRKQKRKHNKRWLYWLVMLVLFISAGVVCYFVWDAYFRERDEDYGDENAVSVAEDDSKIAEEGRGSAGENMEPIVLEKEKVVQYEGGDPNEAEELTGVVTYAGVSGDVLMIRTNIDQYLTDGECELTLVREGATIYSSIASIMSSVTTSACDGFDVPVTGLGGGEININIKLSADGRVGSLHGKVNI